MTSNVCVSILSKNMIVSRENVQKKNANSVMALPVPGLVPVGLNSQNTKQSLKPSSNGNKKAKRQMTWEDLIIN